MTQLSASGLYHDTTFLRVVAATDEATPRSNSCIAGAGSRGGGWEHSDTKAAMAQSPFVIYAHAN